MPGQPALPLSELPIGSKKTVTVGEVKILLVRVEDAAGQPVLYALEAECPHAKAPLEKGAICQGRLVCPWHAGTFYLASGAVLEPPPLRDLKRYHVRLEGETIWVDPAPVAGTRPEPTGQGMHLVFAGGGAATTAALAKLQRANFAGTLTVIEPFADEPVDRTQLTKNALAGKKDLDSLGLLTADPDVLAPAQVQRERAEVVALDLASRQIELSGGKRIDYDALLLATGGRPKRPALPGADLPHVFTIRHTRDLRAMEPYLTPGSRAVLVGDSFIAFEAASALRQRGLATAVLARAEQPFAQKFGPDVAEALLALHRRQGVTVHTGTHVAAITPVSVVLESGAEIPADVVVLAVGVDPVLGYAESLPKSENGGLRVARDLHLNPRTWCAGDIASVEGTRIEHWRLAQQHGVVAATAMLTEISGVSTDEVPAYRGVPFFWTAHFGQRLNYAGHADTWDEIVYEGEVAALDFLAFYLKSGLVVAVLGCKRDSSIAALLEPLRGSLSLEQARSISSIA